MTPTATPASPGPFLARSSDLRRPLSKHTLAGRLGYSQLGLLATTKHKETQQNKGREAGRQVVSGGRNCYRSLSARNKGKRSPECGRKDLYLPVFLIPQLNSLPRFAVSRGLQRDFSPCCDSEACEAAAYAIK